jgi:hypothetical protein
VSQVKHAFANMAKRQGRTDAHYRTQRFTEPVNDIVRVENDRRQIRFFAGLGAANALRNFFNRPLRCLRSAWKAADTIGHAKQQCGLVMQKTILVLSANPADVGKRG